MMERRARRCRIMTETSLAKNGFPDGYYTRMTTLGCLGRRPHPTKPDETIPPEFVFMLNSERTERRINNCNSVAATILGAAAAEAVTVP